MTAPRLHDLLKVKLDHDAAWRRASGPGFDAAVDGPEVAAEADAYSAGIRAALALHQPMESSSGKPDLGYCCLECEVGDLCQEYPCATVRAIASALGVSAKTEALR